MVVGVAEFDGELAAGAPASLEIDHNPVPPQVIARPDDLVEVGDFEGDMVELDIFGRPRHRADQCDAVMVGIAAQEGHAARHHLLRIDVGNLEAQHLGIKPHRARDIAHVDHDMANLADVKRQAVRPLQFLQRIRIDHRVGLLKRSRPCLRCGRALPP